jgi:hypothetical protein
MLQRLSQTALGKHSLFLVHADTEVSLELGSRETAFPSNILYIKRTAHRTGEIKIMAEIVHQGH